MTAELHKQSVRIVEAAAKLETGVSRSVVIHCIDSPDAGYCVHDCLEIQEKDVLRKFLYRPFYCSILTVAERVYDKRVNEMLAQYRHKDESN